MADSATPSAVRQIAYWSAILTTGWILVFDVAIGLGATGAPTRSIAVAASLLLAPSFVVLIASINSNAPVEKKVWGQIGLSFAIVYAALVVWNYYLQLTVVRVDPQLYAWLAMDFKPDTAFWSLETIGYTLMGLAGLFILPIFSGDGIELAIRWCIGANAALAVVGNIGYALTSDPLNLLVLATLGVWAIAFPIAMALLAVVFKRAGKRDA